MSEYVTFFKKFYFIKIQMTVSNLTSGFFTKYISSVCTFTRPHFERSYCLASIFRSCSSVIEDRAAVYSPPSKLSINMYLNSLKNLI